jgi:hypothetical protein
MLGHCSRRLATPRLRAVVAVMSLPLVAAASGACSGGASSTPTAADTRTPTFVATSAPSPVESATASPTPTSTATETATPTSTHTPAPSPTASASSTPTPTERPAPPKTGVTIADVVLAAIWSGDVDSLVSLLHYEKRVCSNRPGPGIIKPPRCPSGVPDGTLVDVIKIGCSTWRYFNREEVEEPLGILLQHTRGFFGLFTSRVADGLNVVPDGGLGLVLAIDEDVQIPRFDRYRYAQDEEAVDGAEVGMDAGGVRGVIFGCGESPALVTFKAAEWISPPAGAPFVASAKGFLIGDRVRVNTHSSDRMIVREWPGTWAPEIDRVNNDTKLTLAAGPAKVDGHIWWHLQEGGWAAEDNLARE